MWFKFLSIWLLVAIAWLAVVDAKNYDGYSLLQVFPDSDGKVNFLIALEEVPGLDIQIWRPGTANTSFDILVSPESKESFASELNENQIRFEVKTEDIQESIKKEKRPVSIHNRAFSNVANAAQFSKYLNLDELTAFIQTSASNYPNIVKIERLGASYERRPIYVVKVGTETGRRKPSVWIDGGIHAREWISVSTVTYMMNKLVTGYTSDPQMKDFVDKIDWYFVPVLNVDGYQFTHSADRMWRKNRRPAPSSCRFSCCPGVDLNRNFDHSFGGAGTSSDTCKDSYRGTGPFSEPETQAVRDFVQRNAGNMKAFITIHAYMQMWFYPYANARGSYPDDIKDLIEVSKKAVEAIRAPYGTEMKMGTPADILYPAAGGSFDWVKSVAKVKYCFGMELRPNQNLNGNGFILPPSNIVPTGEETWAGVAVVADAVMSRFAN